jgi:hypothetical protein
MNSICHFHDASKEETKSEKKPAKPDKDIISQPVPLDEKEVPRNYLASYLAMGFMPVPTSGAENMCGLNSLITSLLAAIKARNLTSVDPKLITRENFK